MIISALISFIHCITIYIPHPLFFSFFFFFLFTLLHETKITRSSSSCRCHMSTICFWSVTTGSGFGFFCVFRGSSSSNFTAFLPARSFCRSRVGAGIDGSEVTLCIISVDGEESATRRRIRSKWKWLMYIVPTQPTGGSSLCYRNNCLGAFGLALANVPAPAPQDFDHLGGHGGRQWHTDEDEALVDCVGQGKLGPNTCRWG